MSNLKPAPLPLTTELTAKLTGDRPAFGRGLVHLPIEGKLVDQPRPGRVVRVLDLNTVPSAMERLADSWRKGPANG